jgi:diketogulonate reductase-like aldo/keto reductase
MVNGLADCYLEGLVSEVGVSNYGPRQLAVITKQLAKRDVPLASAQVSPKATLCTVFPWLACSALMHVHSGSNATLNHVFTLSLNS